MARFYASIEGNRGTATRMGSAASGISAHPRGWDLGVEVRGYPEGEHDAFSVWISGGSHGATTDFLIAEVVETDTRGVRRLVLRAADGGFNTYYLQRDRTLTSKEEGGTVY